MLVNGDEENCLVVSNMAGLFCPFHIYGMSSFPLTFIFFRMVETTNQFLFDCFNICFGTIHNHWKVNFLRVGNQWDWTCDMFVEYDITVRKWDSMPWSNIRTWWFDNIYLTNQLLYFLYQTIIALQLYSYLTHQLYFSCFLCVFFVVISQAKLWQPNVATSLFTFSGQVLQFTLLQNRQQK